ncbi:MAG: hypothetical protein EXS05_06455 [Planctomycetaceae bacterium]|nr:hypothetical protein [Planctomycetaceae bacterium]
MSKASPKHIGFPGIYLFASKPVTIFNRLLRLFSAWFHSVFSQFDLVSRHKHHLSVAPDGQWDTGLPAQFDRVARRFVEGLSDECHRRPTWCF